MLHFTSFQIILYYNICSFGKFVGRCVGCLRLVVVLRLLFLFLIQLAHSHLLFSPKSMYIVAALQIHVPLHIQTKHIFKCYIVSFLNFSWVFICLLLMTGVSSRDNKKTIPFDHSPSKTTPFWPQLEVWIIRFWIFIFIARLENATTRNMPEFELNFRYNKNGDSLMIKMHMKYESI